MEVTFDISNICLDREEMSSYIAHLHSITVATHEISFIMAVLSTRFITLFTLTDDVCAGTVQVLWCY